MSNRSLVVDEVEVTLTIKDGKLTVSSRSGAKNGTVELAVGESAAELVLTGAGTDHATATLTGPELSSFRTIVDAALSSLVSDRGPMADDRRVLASGYQSLQPVEGGFAATLDPAALQRLGLVDGEGELAGGGRQVQCTVLNSGTAILNLLSDADGGFTF